MLAASHNHAAHGAHVNSKLVILMGLWKRSFSSVLTATALAGLVACTAGSDDTMGAEGQTASEVKGGQGNPPGNNGTVKIGDVGGTEIPDNDPHVPCKFQIEFRGYDQGDLHASW